MKKYLWILAIVVMLICLTSGCSQSAAYTQPPPSSLASSSPGDKPAVSAPSQTTSPASGTTTAVTESSPVYGWAYNGEVFHGVCDPTIVTLSDGTYRMYYASFRDWSGPQARDAFIGSAVSKDGLTWTDEGDRGLTGGWPRVVQLADGRYRIYFGNAGQIGIAVSSDGLTWQEETFSGITFTDQNACSGVDIVTLPDGSFRLYYSESMPSEQYTMTGTANILSAVSQDGLAWEKEPGIRLEYTKCSSPFVQHPRIIKLDDRSYKMFVWNANQQIWSALSSDGINWTDVKSEFVMGADPDILVLPDGTTRMYTDMYNPGMFGSGKDSQRMWIYTWGAQSFTLTIPDQMMVRAGRTTSAKITVNGISGTDVSLGYFTLNGQPVTDPPEISFEKASGTVPFSTDLIFSDVNESINNIWGIIITATDGTTQQQILIPVFS